MKILGFVSFIVLLPLAITVMLVPEAAALAQYVFFGIGSLITESLGMGTMIGEETIVYTQLIAASIIPSLPIMAWMTCFSYADQPMPSFLDDFADWLEDTWWLPLLLSLGAFVGIYFYASSDLSLGGIQEVSGSEGSFGWLEDFASNFTLIYGWYAYPVLHTALVAGLVWAALRGADGNVGQIIIFALLGFILLALIPTIYFFLLAILSAFVTLVVAGVLVLGGLAAFGAADDGKIHGHIDGVGDFTIDRW